MNGELKYRTLYLELKEKILEGTYSFDDPLPSIRKLSKLKSLSRTTVEYTYQQLLLEGYIYAVPGVGYFINVLANSSTLLRSAHVMKLNQDSAKQSSNTYLFDFQNEYADPQAFDTRVWKKHINYILTNQSEELLTTLKPQGEMALRMSIAKYIRMARGIEVNPEDIYIGAGIESLLMTLLPTIKTSITGLAIEDPGFSKVKSIFEGSGYPVNPINLTDEGIDINQLKAFKHQVCYVSPAHQFPTGNVMKIENRYQLIKWATDSSSYIIEDDYNAELRYDLFPVPSLKSMDEGDRVIYLGSFSTYLLPAIRISYMILPKEIQKLYKEAHYSQTASKLEQLAFAHMIDSADYTKHIRRIKKYYTKKTEKIHQLIKANFMDIGKLIRNDSGFNVLIELNIEGFKESKSNLLRESELVEKANEIGIGITVLHDYAIRYQGKPTLILNYRGIGFSDMETGIVLLANLLRNSL